MQFVDPHEKTTIELPAPIVVVSDALLEQVSAFGRDDADRAARIVFQALHDAGYRIAVARKQWR